MEMNFRNLVEVLGIDAPVHFTSKDKLNKQNYVFCKFMGDNETAAIIAGNHDPNVHYDDSDLGLHFPDLSLEEYYELEKARNPVGISNHICEVSSQMKININDIPIVFAVHCVLHEYGHWLYFKKTGLTSYQYCEQEKNERQPYENTAREIYKMPDWDPYKRYLAERYDKEIYSKFSSEAAANKYALEHIQDALTKIFESKQEETHYEG